MVSWTGTCRSMNAIERRYDGSPSEAIAGEGPRGIRGFIGRISDKGRYPWPRRGVVHVRLLFFVRISALSFSFLSSSVSTLSLHPTSPLASRVDSFFNTMQSMYAMI